MRSYALPLDTLTPVLVLALSLVSCGTSEEGATPPGASSTAPSSEHHTDEAHEQHAGDAPSTEGGRFDPPRPIGGISAGMWVCDMGGNVHYAASEQGEGGCPVCGMTLTQVGE